MWQSRNALAYCLNIPWRRKRVEVISGHTWNWAKSSLLPRRTASWWQSYKNFLLLRHWLFDKTFPAYPPSMPFVEQGEEPTKRAGHHNCKVLHPGRLPYFKLTWRNTPTYSLPPTITKKKRLISSTPGGRKWERWATGPCSTTSQSWRSSSPSQTWWSSSSPRRQTLRQQAGLYVPP